MTHVSVIARCSACGDVLVLDEFPIVGDQRCEACRDERRTPVVPLAQPLTWSLRRDDDQYWNPEAGAWEPAQEGGCA